MKGSNASIAVTALLGLICLPVFVAPATQAQQPQQQDPTWKCPRAKSLKPSTECEPGET